MNKDVTIGLIYAALGLVGFIVVIFAASPAITLPYLALGFAGFISLFGYGLFKAVSATMKFQINN